MADKKSTMDAEVRKAHGLIMIGRGRSNHWVVMDGPERFQGAEAGARPMELLLISLAGCTGMDVISLLHKMRVKYDDMRVTVESKREEEHPKVYTDIVLHYHFYGRGLPMDKLDKAVRLSQERYCPITAMLKDSVKLSYDIIVHEEIEG